MFSNYDDLKEVLPIFPTLGAFIVWGYQIYDFLRNGVWEKFPASRLLGVPSYDWFQTSTEWLGVQRILDWLIEWNLGLWLAVIGMLWLWLNDIDWN